MTTESILKKVRKIEIKSRGLSNHFFSGAYHTAFKGRGMSFSEVREYSPGDDVRTIDWNVTARLRTPYVKVFHEERELTVMLMIDISASSYFGSFHQQKIELIAELAAVIAFSAQTNNDKIGVLFFSDKIEKYIPPKKGKSHILRIIREIVTIQPSVHRYTDINACFEYFNRATKKRTIAFIISDFVGLKSEKSLNVTARKHDLIGIHVYDDYEKDLQDVGIIKIKDSETGKEYWIDSRDKALKSVLSQSFQLNKEHSRQLFQKNNASFISVNVKEDYVKILHGFFKNRSNVR